MNYGEVCKTCHDTGINCPDGQRCSGFRQTEFRDFGGVRLTADGFDCALPVTIDSHSVCSYGCVYCFSDNIRGHATNWDRPIGETSLAMIEKIFCGEPSSAKIANFQKALKYDNRNAQGFPCPVQIGGLCDPCDSMEQNRGWLLKFIKLAIKYNQPVRMSTKGAIFLIPEYLNAIAERPDLFWVAFSIITNDDAMSALIDRGCPTTSMRLKAMAALHSVGVKTSLRLRPMIAGITDRNQGHIDLIKRAADAGSHVVSYETMFYPSVIPEHKKNDWRVITLATNIDHKKIYKSFGRMQPCTRPAYTWTENIMHEVKEVAHENGMKVGVSDPVWKQLTDYGCCCGIDPEDPVFGNWERENATNALLMARDGVIDEITLDHIIPPWASNTPVSDLVNQGAGPLVAHKTRYRTWADKLTDDWNNPSRVRSAMNYFQGALQVNGKDKNGNLTYKFVGLQRQHIPSIWNTRNK